MTHPKEPPRLRDPGSDASDAMRALLRAGRSELPDADQIARLRARLPLGAPPPGSPPDAPPPASPGALGPAAAGGSLIPSALTGAALAVVVVLGWTWTERAGDRAAPPAIASSAVVAPLPASAPSTPSTSRGADAPSGPSARPSAAATASAAPAIPVSPSTPAFSSEPAAPAPEAPSVAAGSVPPGEGESEARLLGRAQDALASDPSRALSLAGEHARRFPGGTMAEERELLAVAALVRVGRSGEARDRAARFLTSFPRTAYRARLEALVGAGVESFQKIEPVGPRTP